MSFLLWVQLANFMEAPVQPTESNWAMLREAQHSTLSLPQTGEALAIDIGEAKILHPKNKEGSWPPPGACGTSCNLVAKTAFIPAPFIHR